jgi:WD40 repeat protein/serine/threonine protein kinase
MAIASVPSLVDAIGQYRLLEPAQLEELAGVLRNRFQDPRALARELVQRGWLTPYQINQLFQGKGQELVLGQYVLLERLGEGGMGAVFKARHQRLGRIVALKLIRKDRLQSPDMIRRFRREIQAAAQVSHPNVVLAYDADQDRDINFFAMEYVEGIDLGQLVKRDGPLPVALACDYIRQAALGLHDAYRHGLVHRDIKPSNLLLSVSRSSQTVSSGRETASGGTVKILDMGLAQIQSAGGEESATTLTQEGAVMGTPDYIAPEQARSSHNVDIRADLYSLGCTLYYLLTGTAPFPGGTLTQKLLKHQLQEPRPVEQLRPATPPAVAAVVRRLMAKNPEDRYQTPAEAAEVLAEAVLALVRAVPIGPSASGALADDGNMLNPGRFLVPERTTPSGALTEQMRPPNVAPRSGPPATFGPLSPDSALSDTVQATPTPQQLRRAANKRRWLLINAIGGGTLLVLLLVVLVVVLLRKKPAQDEQDDTPAVVHENADEGLAKLLAREKASGADKAQLWKDVAVFRARHFSKPEAARAGEMLLRLLSPLDKLDPGKIAALDRFDSLPKELVAIVGDPRGCCSANVSGVSFNGDGRFIAAGCTDATLCLLDARTLRALAVRKIGGGVFSPDGRTFATSGDGVRLWDVNDGDPKERTALPDTKGAYGLFYSRDGKTLAFADASGTSFSLWDVAGSTPKRRATATGFAGGLHSPLALSPDGNTLIAGSGDKSVYVWDLSGKEPKGPVLLKGHGDWVDGVVVTNDGRYLISIGTWDWNVKVWDLSARPPKEIANYRTDHCPTCLALSPDGKTLAIGLWDSRVWLWSVSGNTLAGRSQIQGYGQQVWGVAFSPDSKSLAVGNGAGYVQVWDVTKPQPLEIIERKGHAPGVNDLAFSPNATLLATVGDDYTARIWDMTGAAPVQKFVLRHIARVWHVAFSPDGKTLATGSEDGALRLWSTTTGKEESVLPAHSKNIHALAFSPDGRQLASGSADGSAKLWDLRSGRDTPRLLESGSKAINCVAFSPDGRKLAIAPETGEIRVRELTSGGGRITLKGHEKGTTRAVFSLDGKMLATSSADGSVSLWDLDTKKELPMPKEHSSQIQRLLLTPDGKKLISAADDRRVILWDIATRKKQTEWASPGPVHGVALACDGRHLAIANRNGTAYVLRLASK